MSAILTQKLRVKSADSFERFILENSTYVYIGKSSEWEDETKPNEVKDSTSNNIEAYEDILGLKRILHNNTISVIPRYDWYEGEVYDQYDDQLDMINELNPETEAHYYFYVFTDEFNVYKCLYNNNGAQSLNKPTGTDVSPFETPDGYIWKYMYSVTTTDAFNYITEAWIPCYTLYYDNNSAQWINQQSAVGGSLDVILVDNPGANYTAAPTVTITGNGSGAVAEAVVDPDTNTIQQIKIINRGSGYSEAEAIISGGNGIGATTRCIISPLNGHGSDARAELGGSHKMIRVLLEGDEGGLFPIDTSYRRAGIIMNPLSKSLGYKLVLEDVSLYKVGETVVGESSGAIGTVEGIDFEKDWMFIDVTSGSFLINENVSSQLYNKTQVLQMVDEVNIPLSSSVVSADVLEPYSGDLLYYSTRVKVTRGEDQIEEVRFIISF